MFFLTIAAAGANVYGCAAPNVWAAEAGGGGGGSTTIQNTGVVVGTRPILNLSTGPGVVQAISDTGATIAIQTSLDTAVAQTLGADQAGAALLCTSASGSTSAYTCSLSPTLTTYSTGMLLHWRPDVTAAGAATLNVDTLGTVPLKLADGATDPAPGDLVAGGMQQLWYDGSVFRILYPKVVPGGLGEAQPSCGVTVRGRLWFVAGASGMKDSLSVCAKDASDSYAWRTLY